MANRSAGFTQCFLLFFKYAASSIAATAVTGIVYNSMLMADMVLQV